MSFEIIDLFIDLFSVSFNNNYRAVGKSAGCGTTNTCMETAERPQRDHKEAAKRQQRDTKDHKEDGKNNPNIFL